MRSNFNWDVLKEPRGFIKIIELLLAIFAFACATGYRGSFKLTQTYSTNKQHPVEGSFKYPFDDPIKLEMVNVNGTIVEEYVPIDERSSAEFFVVIGVFCFLYCVGMLVYYIMFQEDPRSQTAATSGWLNPPVIDFLVGAFWAFFWFVSSCAQAAAVSGIKDATNAEDLKDSLPWCKAKDISCSVSKNTKYGTLTVSILFGFLNTFVWLGNMWFLWKETPFHQKRQQSNLSQPPPPQQHQQVPSSNPI